MALIGIDIGTTSICGLLIDSVTGGLYKALSRPNTAALPSAQPWEWLQDPERIWQTVKYIVDELAGTRTDIRAIGVTGQMHGIVYVDDAGQAVSPLYTWQDQRGELPAGNGQTYASKLSSMTGYRLATGYGAVTHYYLAVNGQIPESAAALCTIGDFVAMKLAGLNRPVTDATHAAGLGLFRLDRLQFDEPAAALAGLPGTMLPQVVASGTVIGATASGIPVVCALGDNQASFLGTVRHVEQTALANIGTGSQLSAYSAVLPELPQQLEARPFPGGGYLLVGAGLSGGKSYELLEQFFREVCRLFTGVEPGSLYERMNELSAQAWEAMNPAHGGLQVNTQFYGTRHHAEQLGSIERISPANFKPQHLIKGFMQGMIAELLAFKAAFPHGLQASWKELRGSGNGIRRNPALQRMLSESFGLPLAISEHDEEAAYGAALCAGAGCGVFGDFLHIGFVHKKER
ncbi:sedoheptulokinase [Paenibacillus thalictri]|uniref:Carbohydrate kinase FGGY N-terminal domain-containing protein n=1 Tax=Paenibacillus thalictri TaxID=2527873 RepID=A0A4Q9DWP7_9BACL|nr:FGGY family carbohydrate kinase [Paenibacillus thalictri]TBL80439.1 hypothetical protein EYB31_08475 [Paenibacillus thalictri]